ncbi:MAG TPA: arylsulfatase [Chitinophagaceae bacterium]
MKRLTTITITGFAMLLFFSGTPLKNKPAEKRPNILLICADDLGWSDIGCYGSEVKTPNLDKLAASGIRFRQFHNTSKCHPSRATLLTGLYAQQNGYFKDFDQPLVNGITIGEYLKSAGYKTMWSGKHHGIENPKTRGFDHYYGLRDGACNYFNPGKQRPGEGKPAQKKQIRYWCIEDSLYAPYTPEEKDFYTTDYFTKYALKWLDEYQNEEAPLFLYMAYNAPHDPLMAWPEDVAKYKGKYDAGYEAIRKARFEKQKKLGLIDSRYKLSAPTHKPWKSLTPAQQKEEIQKMEVYAAMIDRMDRNIGYILDKLKKQGKLDNTLIIFLADNGASGEVVTLDESTGPIGSMTNWTSLGEDWANVGNTPFRYFKNYSYEGGTASPLIVSWKNQIKNTNSFSDYTGHLIDIMATFVDVAKAPYPTTYNNKPILPYEGSSLLPAILHKNVTREKPIFWEWQKGQAVRNGKWKLVRQGLDNNWSLFDMSKDPSETNDLAAANPDIVKQMDQLFKEWKNRVSIVKATKKQNKDSED